MRPSLRLLTTGALALAGAGCVLPVAYTEPASPDLLGALWRSNGAPAAGARVAVTTRRGDSTCAGAVERATADSSGVFRLRATTVRRRGVLLFPAFERFSNAYWLCAPAGDTLLRGAYEGHVLLSAGRGTGEDTVTCQEWAWEGRMRVTCAARGEKTLVTGGRWTAGDASGIYRLILTEEGPLKGPDGNFVRPRLVVQWVERFATGHRDTVRATVALPSGDKFRSLRRLWDPLLLEREGRPWCLSVESDRWRFVGPGRERFWFELGAPGEARPVPSC